MLDGITKVEALPPKKFRTAERAPYILEIVEEFKKEPKGTCWRVEKDFNGQEFTKKSVNNFYTHAKQIFEAESIQGITLHMRGNEIYLLRGEDNVD